MRIEKVEVFPVRLPLKKPVESAHGLVTHQESMVLKILTARGEYGIGAIEPLPGYDKESMNEIMMTLQNHLVPRIIGEDPMQIRRISEIMDAEIPGHLDRRPL